MAAETDKATAVVFLGTDRSLPYVIKDVSLPNPEDLQEGEALVAVDLATVCGSDLHTLRGIRQEPTPCVMGHEGCGVVVTSRRNGVPQGQRVTWGVCNACGDCLFCRLGLSNKCQYLLKYGHVSVTSSPLSGTYASHILLRAGTPIVPLPPDIPPTTAAPANCALATVMNAVSVLPQTPTPGREGARIVLVQGAGLLGVYACAVLRDRGFPTVMCVDPHRSRLSLANKFGAVEVFTPDQEEEKVTPSSVDVVLEVCGSAQAVPRGVRALRPGGFMVLAGMVHPDSRLSITGEDIIRKCLTIKGVHNYAGEHLEQAVEFLGRRRDLPYEALLGPTFPIHDFKCAVELARSSRFCRVAINPKQHN